MSSRRGPGPGIFHPGPGRLHILASSGGPGTTSGGTMWLYFVGLLSAGLCSLQRARDRTHSARGTKSNTDLPKSDRRETAKSLPPTSLCLQVASAEPYCIGTCQRRPLGLCGDERFPKMLTCL